MTTLVYPGTFDPITLGHTNLIERVAGIFDQVVIAIAASERKQPLFNLDERLTLARDALAHLPNVRATGFRGLLVDIARQESASFILRGVRNSTDFEYELPLAQMNSNLAPGIDTLFLTPPPQLTCVSSSLIREIASMGGDVAPYVPANVATALAGKFPRP